MLPSRTHKLQRTGMRVTAVQKRPVIPADCLCRSAVAERHTDWRFETLFVVTQSWEFP
jgi:hypothetical protein